MKEVILVMAILMAIMIPHSNGMGTGERAPALSPSPPKNLTVRCMNGYVVLEWEPASAATLHPVEKYNIYRGETSSNETYLAEVDSSITSYSDKNVVIGKTYYYYVTAVNDVGESNASNEVHIIVENEKRAPDPPRDLVAMRGENYVFLTWEKPVYDGSATITEYRIYRNGDRIASVTTVFLRYNDTGVDIHGKYTYYITAVNSVGESDKSNEVVVQWTKPAPPVNLKIERNGDYAILTWEQGYNGGLKIREYRIYVNYGNGWKYVGDTTANSYKLKISPSLLGDNVKIKVTEVNALGESEGIITEASTPSSGIILYVSVIAIVILFLFLVYYFHRRRS